MKKNSLEIINLEHIEKEYFLSQTQSFKALRDITLKINKGEFVAIVGSSGSGKSTLMNIIGFLDIPTAGEYEYKGIKFDELSEDELTELRSKEIGFIFQSFHLLPSKTVFENVKLPLVYSGVVNTKKQYEEYVTSALEKSDLDKSLWYKKPNQLSGGQRQRVAIARALVNKPEVLLADEPTGNLDSKTGQKVLEELKQLNREENVTVIMITHDKNIAKNADRVITVKDGIII
ncbi:macrolide ABC transporter ATP-binding protein [Candidatus Campbellbacteria bacterium]|nr:MAG: macrolide ABC transporter ATP-binding protein [Candidatus Campbellbacteria bacterium]